MKLRLPWQKAAPVVASSTTAAPGVCTHPHVDVEMHGTAIKRRWCTTCGQELPVAERRPSD